MESSRSLSTSSTESISFSDDWDSDVEKNFKDFWSDPVKIDAMKRIWTSSESKSELSTEKIQDNCFPIKYNAKDNYLTKKWEYKRPGCDSTCPTVFEPGFDNRAYYFYRPSEANSLAEVAYFNPVTSVKPEIEQLTECFMILESLDRDIKTCEQMLSIMSLSHPIALPVVYNMREVERLLIYSEKQLEWYNKFAEHVEARFVWEKKLKSRDQNIALLDVHCNGIVWDKGSFQDIIFSTMTAYARKWSRANSNIFVLLKDIRKLRSFANPGLVLIYISEVAETVISAKTSVWDLMKEIKMMKTSEFPAVETSQQLAQRPTTSTSRPKSNKEVTKSQSSPPRLRRGKNKKLQLSV